MISFQEKLQQKVWMNSKELLTQASFYGIRLDFSMDIFMKFHQDLFSLYQSKNLIYQYADDMHVFLSSALFKKTSNHSILKMEDILR